MSTMNPEDKKLDKLDKILSMIDEDYVSPKDLGEVVDAVAVVMNANKKESLEGLSRLIEDTDGEVKRLDGRIDGVAEDVAKAEQSLRKEIAKVKTIKGDKGEDGKDGKDGKDGSDGKDGKDGKDGVTISPDQVVAKVNTSQKLINKERVEGLADIERIAKSNAAGTITTSFINGKRAKNINFTGATVTHQDDTALVAITAGGGAVDSVNGATGDVVLDADDISDTTTTNKFATAAEKTKLGHISITQAVDLDALETASHAAATLVGEDFLSITGQQITANPIDLDNLSATGTPSSSTFLRGDNTWATPAGSGDVSKVGTPVNNQVGVWTGDGTLEGDTALTFDTTTDTLATGIVTVTDDPYGAGWDGSTAVPTKNAIYDKIETIASGGITRTVVVTSGATNMGSTAATDYVYFVAGAHTMSLPAASGNTNRYTVKNTHSANITIDTVGAETIEGAASISIIPESSVDIVSNGTNWFII